MLQQTYLAPDERRLLSRFWQSASGFWRDPSAWSARLLIALLIAVVLLQLLTQYWLNFWNRDFFDAIERKDGAELWTQALRFAPLAGASLALAIISVWGRMTMQRKWREWLSNHLYDYWLENGHYRRLRFMSGDHQTPEYRIAEDARVATDLPIDLVLGLLSSILTAIIFIGVLWSVGGDLVIDAFGLPLAIPGYLVIAVVIYSMVFTAAMMLIGRHLTRVFEESKRAEAELRAIGTHLRESGEGAALPDGRKDGRRAIGAALEEVIARWLALCWQLMRMTLVTHTNSLLTPVVGLLLCTRKYLAGMITLGEVVVRHGAGRVQLDHRQLWTPCGVGLFGKPRGIPPSCAGSDRCSERSTNPGIMIAGINDNASPAQTELKLLVVKLLEEVADLCRTVAAQRDEIARLKGGPGRPNIKPNSKPSVVALKSVNSRLRR